MRAEPGEAVGRRASAPAETAEVEEVLEQGVTLLFAVDQSPFQVAGQTSTNTFGLLLPLITEGGRRLTVSERFFPRRGRVWWMLRPEIDPEGVVAGMIWSGTLERTKDHQSDEPKKDWYQINKRTATPGSRHHVEVLDLPEGDPEPADLLSAGLRWHRPTLPRVLVRGARWVVGPFRASFDPQHGRVGLLPSLPGEPWVYRLGREVLEKARTVQEFSFTSNQHNPSSYAPRVDVRLALLHERHLEALVGEGEKLDAATDQQVINTVFKKLKLSRREQQTLHDILQRSSEVRADVDEKEFAGRLERFRKIVADAERISRLGAETAELVAGQEAFRELLDRHKQALVQERVAEEVSRLRSRIEAEVAALREQEARVRKQLEELEEVFDRTSREIEEKFQKDNEARLRELEAREARVAAREEELAQRESEMEARLKRVLDDYRNQAERIGDQIVAHLPLLRRAGVLSGAGGAAEPDGRPAALPLPAFLAAPRPRGDMDEVRFVQQFEHVVARRAFAFAREDLINFHVAVKTGLWTVLAGASGLGKSSLPRLYAEALGASDEHLLVPVRPDWLDDRDVIGAFNALSGRYEPAPSGLVDRLIAAHEDERRGRGGIYIICLDEMNLARVEHYFAAFLSLLEQPAQKRSLQLFAPGLERPGDPYAPHRVLPLGANLRFVGTVNIDETTHFFSPKVIDRAPIVAFERPSLKQGLAAAALSATLSGIVPIHLDDYRSWIAEPGSASPAVLELLLKVDEALRESRGGVGFRVRDRILAYVASARRLLEGEDAALDLAVLGNIAPRLRPNAPGAEKALGALRDLLPRGRFPRTAALLEAMAAAEGERDFFQLV